jgi:hypothetical protein
MISQSFPVRMTRTYHIVYATEHSVTAVPVAKHSRVVFRFVPSQVLLARETPTCGLRTVRVTAEERLGVTFVVLPEVATSGEDSS